MADQLSPKSLNELGDAYFTGTGKPLNKEMAYTYYKQAADLDNPVGHFNIGKYFLDKSDYKNAIEAFHKAKSYKYAPALLELAKMVSMGKGMKKNKKKAFKFYEEAAQYTDLDAYMELANCYEIGYGTKKNVDKAKEYYKKAADHLHPAALYKMGLYALSTPKEKTAGENAIAYFDKAASLNHVGAMKQLIKLYDGAQLPAFKKKSVQYCKEMVFYYTEMLAKANDIQALEVVSFVYYEGNDIVKKNHEKAANYFLTLAELDHPSGLYGLGISYLYGHGLRMDLEKAKVNLEKAANKGHVMAMTKLGDYIRMRAKSASDFELAKDWYMQAAKLNEVEALINLGLLNYRSQVENANPQLARQYFETAAKKGASGAYYWLGVIYQKGDGVDQNFEIAKKNFEKAITSGHLGAKYKLATMYIESSKQEKLKQKVKKERYIWAHRYLLDYILDPNHNQANYVVSMNLLGYLYEFGLGVDTNKRAARYWNELAATNGNSDSMVWMFHALKNKEVQEALKYLEDACKLDDAYEAHYQLGMLYLEGFAPLLKIDIKKAKQHFEIASRGNHPSAVAKLLVL
jgi:uncharacterized protein